MRRISTDDRMGPAQLKALFAVLANYQAGGRPLSLSEIARRCGFSAARAHQAVRDLKRRGLVDFTDLGRRTIAPRCRMEIYEMTP